MCASTRAFHLEHVQSLNVDQFLLAFCRFASHRGLPSTLWLGNAKTFKSSAKEIQWILGAPENSQYLTNRHLKWKSIIDRAPWWGEGGGREEMVKIR